MKTILILVTAFIAASSASPAFSSEGLEAKCEINDGTAEAILRADDMDVSVSGKVVMLVFDDKGDMIIKRTKERDLVVSEGTSTTVISESVDDDASYCEVDMKKTSLTAANRPSSTVQFFPVEQSYSQAYSFPSPAPVVVVYRSVPRTRTIVVDHNRRHRHHHYHRRHHHRDVVVYRDPPRRRVVIQETPRRVPNHSQTNVTLRLPSVRVKL